MEPTNNKYLTNDLSELKREALANLDVSLLKKILWYEQRLSQMKICYVREGETQLHDQEGNPTTLKSVGIDPYWSNFYLFRICYALALPLMPDLPGDLYGDISILSRNSALNLPVRILEVPACTSFPLPKDFDWWQVCKEYAKSGQYVDRRDSRRLCRE